MLLFNRFILLTALFAITISATANANPKQIETVNSKVDEYDISYSIEPYYDLNIFRFIVVLEFKGEKSGETKIQLPANFYGINNLSGIKNLKPLSENTFILETDQPENKIVKYSPGSSVKIYYQVEEVRQGNVALGNHYMVILKKQYFHFFGEAFFILPEWDSNPQFKFRIIWNHMPQTWNLANSFGANEKIQSFNTQISKFRNSVFTGGDFRIIKRSVQNFPVFISIRGKWLFTDDQISDMIQKIIFEERNFWNDYKFSYYLVTIFPIDGNGEQSGMDRTNSCSLFLSSDRIQDYKLKRVIAHEAFHAWLGDKIVFSEPEKLLYWFKEGFSEYYARLLLLRAGLIGLDEYVAEYNKVLKNYYTSPVRGEKNSRVIKEFGYDPDFTKLPYLRGDIIAHNLNAAILRKTNGRKSLDDLMREILQRSVNENLILSTGSLSSLIRYYSDDETTAEILRTLNIGTKLKSYPEALGPCFTMSIDTYKRFWLFGELFSVPIYKYKYPELQKESSCLYWFGKK